MSSNFLPKKLDVKKNKGKIEKTGLGDNNASELLNGEANWYFDPLSRILSMTLQNEKS